MSKSVHTRLFTGLVLILALTAAHDLPLQGEIGSHALGSASGAHEEGDGRNEIMVQAPSLATARNIVAQTVSPRVATSIRAADIIAMMEAETIVGMV